MIPALVTGSVIDTDGRTVIKGMSRLRWTSTSLATLPGLSVPPLGNPTTIHSHWEAKEHPGPSDDRAPHGGPEETGRSAEGVDAASGKRNLLDLARRLQIRGRWSMSKDELVCAIKDANHEAKS